MAMVSGQVAVLTVVIVSCCCMLMGSLIPGVEAQCTLNDLAPCLEAVTKGVEPDEACCAKVAVVNVPCFCNLVKDAQYPPNYVTNAIAVPQRCKGAAYAHFKGQSCAGHVIS